MGVGGSDLVGGELCGHDVAVTSLVARQAAAAGKQALLEANYVGMRWWTSLDIN